jgi:phosphatidate cytidylyltransferase
MTGPDPSTPDLRAAHRARHLAAAPDAAGDLDADEDDEGDGWVPEPGREGRRTRVRPAAEGSGTAQLAEGSGTAQLAGEDWPAAGDPAGGWRLAREFGDPHRPVPSADADLARREPAHASEGDPVPRDPAHGADAYPLWPAPPGAADAGPVWPEPVETGEPAGTDPAQTGEPTTRKSRAGRNLPAAIGVGLLLGGAVLASLLLWKPAFYGVIVLAVWIATWELVRAVAGSGLRPPMIPLLLGGTAMMGMAWYGGAEALLYGLLGTVLAVLVWRLADGPAGYQGDLLAGLLIATYAPFLGGFVVLLLAPDDGHLRVLAMLIGVVLSDTGGYVFGVFLGRRKLAPSVSPGKSWEGLGGSVFTAAVGGALIAELMFGDDWWRGVVFGVTVAIGSTLGDLAESLLKRDLKVKDMSNLLPGHGGLMDRLDSILIAAPAAYTVLTLLIPPG